MRDARASRDTSVAPVVRVQDSYGLTPTQAGMLHHALRSAPGSGVDIQQISLTLPETLDPDAWVQAFEEVCTRHTTLRTRLRWEGVEQPQQDVLETVFIPTRRVDWRDLDERALREHLLEQAAAERAEGFELGQAPLMRLFLAQLADDTWSILWTFHHLILDGRSFAGLIREVFEVYDARQSGREPDTVPGRSFADYVVQLAGMDLAAAETFWRTTLQGFRHPVVLPLQRPDLQQLAERDGALRQGARQRRLGADTSQALRARAAALGVGVGTLVHLAWAVLQHRYTGSGDLVFATTRSCAHLLPVDGTVARGAFINTVPLRVALEPDAPVADSVTALRRAQLDMRPFEWAPLARIQTWSEVDRALPLCESAVVYDHESLGQRMRRFGGRWLHRHVDYVGQTSFPLALVAYGDDEILLRLEYDRQRFLDGAIERMLGHVAQLLGGLADERCERVRDLPLLTAEDRQQLTAPASTAQPFPRGPLLHQWFESRVAVAPHAPAVTAADAQGRRIELSYAQLNERANRLAHRLRAHGVRPNQLVGLRTERNAELVIGLLAILKAGGAYLPLDPVYPRERVAFMLQDAAVELVLTQASLRAELAHLPVQTLCIDDASAAPFRDAENLVPVNGPDDMAYVIYTSGSTGTPKGVRISHHNVCRLFSATHRWFGFDDRDVWTLFHSYAFDFSVWELWGALLYGGRLVVVDQALGRDAEAFRDLLAHERVTVLSQTPTAFRRLVDLCTTGEPTALSLRYVIFGGEALDLQMLRPWFQRYGDRRPSLVNMYGITETTVHVTWRPVTMADVEAGRGSVIGIPIPDLRVILLDAHLQPVPVGVPGEIVVAGAGVSAGYLHRPELTDHRFISDPFDDDSAARLYRSGDLARRLEDGELEYLGRADQQVKIRGFRIELGEIEARLGRHPAVRQCAVVARELTPGDKRLVAYLVTGSEPAAVVDECRRLLRDSLPDYMVPAHFVLLAEMPLNSNGKLDRLALPAPADVTAPSAPPDAPRTALEAELVAIWKSVLRVDRVGIHDHFMDLGGDSILSIQVLARCRERGLALGLRDLYQRPTIAELAGADGTFAAPHAATVEPGTQDPVADLGFALTPIQHWFFEQDFAEAHHWNQAFLFELPQTVTGAAVRTAWRALVEAHPALRTRYEARRCGVVPVEEPRSRMADVVLLDLSSTADDALRAAIEERTAEAQAGLDPREGPLARAVHIACGERRPARLLIVVHHLAVDGVSWRMLVEDFESAVRSAQAGQVPRLPAGSASPRQWADALAAHTRQNPAVLAALPYWRAVSQTPTWSLPTLATSSGRSVPGLVCVELDEAQTRRLLTGLPMQFGTQVTAALLSALLRAVRVWTSATPLRIDLEGHGREPIDRPIDVTRTVGWFTSLYPMALELDPQADAATALMAVDRQLQQVPDKGRSYGLLRYLSDDPQLQRTLAATAPAPVLFNYLGQFDAVLAGSSLLRMATESAGPWRSAQAHRTHPLEVIAWIRDDRLEVQWHHDAQALLPEAVARVAHAMRRTLEELVDLAMPVEDGRADANGDGSHAAPSGRGGDGSGEGAVAASGTGQLETWGEPTAADADTDLDLDVDVGFDVGAGAAGEAGLGGEPGPAADADSIKAARATLLSDADWPDLDLNLPPPPPQALEPQPVVAPEGGTGQPSPQPPEPVALAPYPLTPMQRLYFAMDTVRPELGLEQWHFELNGPLQVPVYQQAWRDVLGRHDILHSAFAAGPDGRPVQCPTADVEPVWTVRDVPGLDRDGLAEEVQRQLQTDRSIRLPLDQPPLMRMTLLRTDVQTWQWLWTTHHLVIDGWSWPIVLEEVSEAYATRLAGREPAWVVPLPYRRYVEWLARAGQGSAEFWQSRLHAVNAPTPVARSRAVVSSASSAAAPGRHVVDLAPALSSELLLLARQWRVTAGALFNAAWALVLAHGSAQSRVVLGAAFSGRPPELAGIERMVGPCVHDVPLCIELHPGQHGLDVVLALHRELIEVAEHQYLPLDEIQQCSAVPSRHRLFDSLVVVQNYQVGDGTRSIGDDVLCTLHDAPEATNFPLTIAVGTGAAWQLRFLFDRRVHAESDLRHLADEVVAALQGMVALPDATVGDWLDRLPAASRGSAHAASTGGYAGPRPIDGAASMAVDATSAAAALASTATPRRTVEAELLALWQELFGTNAIGPDDNFFDLGGHSLLLVRAHRELQIRLQRDVPLLALLQNPSIRSLGRHLTGGEPGTNITRSARDRAERARRAQAQQREWAARRTNG